MTRQFMRVLKGKEESDFDYLSLDFETRKLVFAIDFDNYDSIHPLDRDSLLKKIGYSKKDISCYSQYQLRLVTFFEQEENQPLIANWENVLCLTEQVYGVHNNKLLAFERELKERPYQELSENPDYHTGQFMNLKNLMRDELSAVRVRKFLEDSLRLNSLFSGDGYVYNQNGEKLIQEYIMRNTRVDSLVGARMFSLSQTE